MAATKLRSSSMSLHGVFHKSRVFDPTCLYEAKSKPMPHRKCLFGSFIANYSDVECLYRAAMILYKNNYKNHLIVDYYLTNYNYSVDNDADDYLVTLPIQLEAGKNYNVVVNARNAGIDERFEVLLGTEPTADALTITVIGPTDVTTYDDMGEEYEGLFTVNEAGKYYIAIHAISEADKYRLTVNYLSIEFGPEPTAPAAPGISVVADEQAALRAEITLTAPNTALNGDALTTNLERIDILRDGAVVGSVEHVVPGSSVVYVDEPDYVGDHTYQAIPYNESGKGLKSEKVTVYVGPDVPSAVENLTAADGGDIVALS